VRIALILLGVIGCSARKDPPAPPGIIAPGVTRTDASEPGGMHTTITGTDVDLAALPMREWIGLPASGHGSIALDVHVPTGNVAGATGTIELHCLAKCRLGDDHAVIQASAKSRMLGDLQFGHIDFDRIDVKIAIGGGHADVTEWKVESPDVELDVKGKLVLANKLNDSRIDACVRFRAKPDFTARDPKTSAVIELTGAPKAADGFYNIALADKVTEMKRLGRVCDGTVVAADPAPPAEPAAAPMGTIGFMPAETPKLDVKKRSDTEFDVGIAGLFGIRQHPAAFMKSGRLVPAIENGKPIGFKVFAVTPDGMLAQLGLQNGDLITAIDGRELTTPDKALEAYTQLAGRTVGQSIVLSLRRKDAPLTITYHLR